MKFHAYLVALVLALFGSDAHAQRCDPLEILKSDTDEIILQDEAALVYFRQLDSQQSSARRNQTNAKAIINGVSLGFGKASASALTRSIKDTVGIDYSTKSHRHLLRSTISDNSIEAYQACLKSDGIEIDVPENAHMRSEFGGKIIYRENGVNQDVRVSATSVNGNVTLYWNGNEVDSVRVRPGSEVSYTVSGRQVGSASDLLVSVTAIGNPSVATETYSLPPYIPYKIELKPKRSALIVNTISWEDKGDRTRGACITADPGYTFLPDSASMLTRYVNGRKRVSQEITESDTVQVCGTNYVKARYKRTTINSQVYAQQFRVVKLATFSDGET